MDKGNEYVIEKAYRRYPKFDLADTVFEYAMCFDCMLQLHSQMSEMSLRRIEAYFENTTQFKKLTNTDEASVEVATRLSRCMIKGTHVDDLSEYQIIGLFQYNLMLTGPFPYMIGGEAMDEIAALLSNKTLGEMDDFMDKHFGLPPELRKLFLDNPVMFI